MPDPARVTWMFDTYAWLLEGLGGFERLKETPLVLCNDEFFPVAHGPREVLAEALFCWVKQHAGMPDWPVRLVAQPKSMTARDVLSHGMTIAEKGEAGAAGTFSVGPDSVATITYSESAIAEPEVFVATMAHELSHYLMACLAEPNPGGEAEHEPATDLCSIFLGFGVPTANAAFRFRQYSDGHMQGWATSGVGYLTEQERAYALAMFLALTEGEVELARKHLRPNPRAYLKDAIRDLERHHLERLAELRKILPKPAPA